jgi:tetratricopeptide (TPR) repeat protein
LAKRARTSANYPTEIGQILAAALQIRAECECRKGDSLDEPDRYGQYALAFHDYSEAFDFSHDNGLLLGWASVSEHLGLCDRTGPIADHLLMVGEFVAPAHVLRAYCQARGKLPGSVDESLIKALDALRGERNARFDRGQVGLELGYFFLRQKLPVYAVEALRIAVDLKTQKANGMLCQALVLSDNVNAKNVCTDASRESDPVRAAMALRGQSWLARNEGDLPAALNYNRQAAARDPTPELQLDYSDLLRGVGRTTGADEILSRLIDDQYLPALWRRHDLRCAAGKVVPARDDGIKFVNACARSGECNEKRVLTLCPGPYARKAFQRGVSTPSSN